MTAASQQPVQSGTQLRLRDLLVLVLCAFAVILTFQYEGAVTLHEAFSLPTDTGVYANGHFPSQQERLPHPLVADLDNDGIPEIIIATHAPPSIKVYNYRSLTANDDSLGTLVEKATISLQGDVLVKRLRQAGAMATGALGNDKTEVIVVLTKGLSVLCFGSSFQLRWEHPLQKNIAAGFFLMEASIVIAPSSTQHEGGLVIVGARVGHPSSFSRRTITVESAKVKSSIDEETELSSDEAVDDDGHFSYYALDGTTGSVVWKHEEGDFLSKFSGPKEQTEYLSEHFKADARVPLRHRGEEDWRHYRSAILHAAVPHRWATSDDTHLHLAHFEKNRRVGGAGGPGRNTKRRHGQLEAGESPEIQDSTFATDLSHKRVAQTLGFDGLEALQETLFPESAARPVDTSTFNVVVAHLHDSIEVLQLYSGQPVCRVALGGDAHGETGVYADVNADGVLDHVIAVVGEGSDRVFRARGAVPQGSNCYALARSGVPPLEPLFNGSLCDDGGMLDEFFGQASKYVETQGQSYGQQNKFIRDKNLEAVAPLMVPRTQQGKGVMFDSVFLVSDGKVTAYAPTGTLLWHLQTAATWPAPGERGMLHIAKKVGDTESPVWAMDIGTPSAFRASLTLMSRRTFAPVTTQTIYIVATGWNAMVVLDPSGNILSTLPLATRGALLHTPVYADFNGDGYTDILLVRRNGIDGLLVEHHSGSVIFSGLVYLLLGVLLLLLLRQAMLPRLTSRPDVAARVRVRGTD